MCISVLLRTEKGTLLGDVNILIAILHAILEVSVIPTSVSMGDKQHETSSRQSQNNESFLVTRVLRRKHRLRLEMVHRIPCILFTSAMHSLQSKYHPIEASCRESCCGHQTCILGDYAALSAQLLEHLSAINDHAYKAIGGRQMIALIVQNCCDTRVVLCVVRYLVGF